MLLLAAAAALSEWKGNTTDMQPVDIIHFSDAYLALDGQIAGTSLGGTLRLTGNDTGEIVLSPLAQAQLLEHLYQRRGQLYRLATLDLTGQAAPEWIRSDPHAHSVARRKHCGSLPLFLR